MVVTPGLVDFLQNAAVGNLPRVGANLVAAQRVPEPPRAPRPEVRAGPAQAKGPVRVVVTRGGR